MKRNLYLCVGICILLSQILCCRTTAVKSEYISYRQAIRIAEKRLSELGILRDDMDVGAKLLNEPWNGCILKEDDSPENLDIVEILRVKGAYWYLYFAVQSDPDRGRFTLGGIECVFVDAKTGDLILSVALE